MKGSVNKAGFYATNTVIGSQKKMFTMIIEGAFVLNQNNKKLKVHLKT